MDSNIPDLGYTDAAQEVMDAELAIVHARPGRPQASSSFIGLALSGGGIRSASFSLGILHALVVTEKLKYFDYLSTVSGGGYTGTALTWMLSTFPGAGVEPTNFPLSSETEGAVGVAGKPRPKPEAPLRALDWIRRRGRYLTPTRHLDLISVVGVVLRAMTISLFVALALAVASFVGLRMALVALSGWLPNLGTLDALPIPDGDERGFWNAGAWLAVVTTSGFVLGSLAFALTTRFGRDRPQRVYDFRSEAQVWTGRLLKFLALAVALASLPAVRAQLSGIAWESALSFMTVGGGASLVRLALTRRSGTRSTAALEGTLAIVAAATLVYGLLLLAYSLSGLLMEQSSSTAWIFFAFSLLLALIVGLGSNANYTSPHRMYRDRLMEAFMPTIDQIMESQSPEPSGVPSDERRLDPDRAFLADLGLWGRDVKGKPVSYAGPYHLINANMVVGASAKPSLHERGGESFLLSPLYCGSSVTGWRPTHKYSMVRTGDSSSTMTLASAMAISGAAANPHTGAGGRGVTRSLPVGVLMGLFNLRLGYFEVNPDEKCRKVVLPARPNHIWPCIGETLGWGAREDAHFVELSDGGHFENLGVYELLRREVDLIVCCDGSADPNFHFAELANLIERARVDFGINIDFVREFEPARLALADDGGDTEKRMVLAQPGFALGRISYPAKKSADGGAGNERGKTGILVYLKSTLIPGLPADLMAYRLAHPTYPHETTADQFFDEAQFEAYRELGYRIGHNALAHPLLQILLRAPETETRDDSPASEARIKTVLDGRQVGRK